MENAFSRFIMKEISEARLCRELEIALGNLPFEDHEKQFTVQVTNQKGAEKFFGMRVFPKIEELDNFCKDLVNEDSDKLIKFNELAKRWKNIGSWFLELDGTIFDRNVVNFTPKELVALTLHEIGHIIYSDRPVEGFYRAYREAKVRMTISDRATQKLMYTIYMIPLSVACMQRRWANEKSQVNVEIIADKTVVELGFGEYLVEALDKIIRRYGSINADENQLQAEIDSSVQWCNINIADVIRRKDTLKDELYYRAIRTKSNYVKAVTIITLDKLGFKMKERYTGCVVENSIELLSDPKLMEKYVPVVVALEAARFDKQLGALQHAEEVALEAVMTKRKKIKATLPSQFEIDALSVEVDKIVNHADRIFCLDLLYNLYSRLTDFEETIAADPQLVRKWSGTIEAMKLELEQIRKAILEKKNLSKEYRFFCKLDPVAKDYEG